MPPLAQRVPFGLELCVYMHSPESGSHSVAAFNSPMPKEFRVIHTSSVMRSWLCGRFAAALPVFVKGKLNPDQTVWASAAPIMPNRTTLDIVLSSSDKANMRG